MVFHEQLFLQTFMTKINLKMKIKVNGKDQQFDLPELPLVELLGKNNVSKPELVSIQINGAFLMQDQYHHTVIKDNDEVDFLYFMGGGC
jgi:sulfur carrier protein